MAIKLAGTPSSQIGNVPLTQNVSGGYLQNLKPTVFPNALVDLGKVGMNLGNKLLAAEKEVQKERDSATVLQIQNIVNSRKHNMKQDWSNVDGDRQENLGLGLNANKDWANGQIARMNKLLSSFTDGNVSETDMEKFASANGMTMDMYTALKASVADLGPAGKLALARYTMNQNDAWTANVVQHQMVQSKAAKAKELELAIAVQEEKILSAPSGQLDVEINDILIMIDDQGRSLGLIPTPKTSADGDETLQSGASVTGADQSTTYKKSPTLYSERNMLVVNQLLNKIIPQKVDRLIEAGRYDEARKLIDAYKDKKLNPNGATDKQGQVRLTTDNLDVMQNKIADAELSGIIKTEVDSLISGEDVAGATVTVGDTSYSNFSIEAVFKKIDAKLGTLKSSTSNDRWTASDLQALKTRVKEKHAVNKSSLDDAYVNAYQEIQKQIKENPEVELTSAQIGQLKPEDVPVLLRYQRSLVGSSDTSRPILTDKEWMLENFSALPKKLQTMPVQDLMKIIDKYVAKGDEAPFIAAWQAAQTNRENAEIKAAALVTTPPKKIATDINDASKKVFDNAVNERVSQLEQMFSGNTQEANRNYITSRFRAVAEQEFYERMNTGDATTVMTNSDAKLIVNNLGMSFVGDRKGKEISDAEVFDNGIDRISIGVLIGDVDPPAGTDKALLKNIRAGNKYFANIPEKHRYEVAALYTKYLTKKNLNTGVDIKANMKDLDLFVKSVTGYINLIVSDTAGTGAALDIANFINAVNPTASDQASAWAGSSVAQKTAFVYKAMAQVVSPSMTINSGGNQVVKQQDLINKMIKTFDARLDNSTAFRIGE